MHKIHFLTGASGVGKTTLLKQLKEKYFDKNWVFLHFDSIGVPKLEIMERNYGSGAEWQKAMTYEWIDRMINDYTEEKIFLEGQVDLEFIRNGFKRLNFKDYQIILIDCNEAEMTRRLTEGRNQPDLLTSDMKNWLKFLRNQASEMQVPILDTSFYQKEQALSAFEKIIEMGNG